MVSIPKPDFHHGLLGSKVAARVEGGRGGAIDVTEITMDGDSVEFAFERSFQGSSIDIVMTLTLDGDMINATQDIGGGQFSMSGTGKKKMEGPQGLLSSTAGYHLGSLSCITRA